MIKVFIAISLDGYIADLNGSVDFLYDYPDTEGEDMGYLEFIASIDALVMGRKTFETVLGFDVDWPYDRPVFVWTTELREVPSLLEGKVHLISGSAGNLVQQLKTSGYNNLYIDGGMTIRSFLKEDLVDEITLTTIPVLLGSGIPLFAPTNGSISFTCIASRCFPNGVTQSKYKRK